MALFSTQLFSRLPSTCQAIVVPCFGNAVCIQNRTATKRGGGSTRNGRDSAGRRLGLKKTEGQAVIPGNVIIRQRGYTWHPGQHVGVGKDHTLFATAPGFVRFYKAPAPGRFSVHGRSQRKYCGVVLEREEKLPRAFDQPRSRWLGPKVDLSALEALVEAARQTKQGVKEASEAPAATA